MIGAAWNNEELLWEEAWLKQGVVACSEDHSLDIPCIQWWRGHDRHCYWQRTSGSTMKCGLRSVDQRMAASSLQCSGIMWEFLPLNKAASRSDYVDNCSTCFIRIHHLSVDIYMGIFILKHAREKLTGSRAG
uniref:Uncharacterized protein n=1 Tax=Arundo donax TaxID=35708 RepID=A0A0A9DVD2_ARUDO